MTADAITYNEARWLDKVFEEQKAALRAASGQPSKGDRLKLKPLKLKPLKLIHVQPKSKEPKPTKPLSGEGRTAG